MFNWHALYKVSAYVSIDAYATNICGEPTTPLESEFLYFLKEVAAQGEPVIHYVGSSENH